MPTHPRTTSARAARQREHEVLHPRTRRSILACLPTECLHELTSSRAGHPQDIANGHHRQVGALRQPPGAQPPPRGRLTARATHERVLHPHHRGDLFHRLHGVQSRDHWSGLAVRTSPPKAARVKAIRLFHQAIGHVTNIRAQGTPRTEEPEQLIGGQPRRRVLQPGVGTLARPPAVGSVKRHVMACALMVQPESPRHAPPSHRDCVAVPRPREATEPPRDPPLPV